MALPALSTYGRRPGTVVLDRRGRPVMTTRGGLQQAAAESAANLGGKAYEESIQGGDPHAALAGMVEQRRLSDRYPDRGAMEADPRYRAELGRLREFQGLPGESTSQRPEAGNPYGFDMFEPGIPGSIAHSVGNAAPPARAPAPSPAGGGFGKRVQQAMPSSPRQPAAAAPAGARGGRHLDPRRFGALSPQRRPGAASPPVQAPQMAPQPRGALTPQAKEPLIGRDASLGLLAAGLGTMAAGGRRGTTAVGALGEGGLAGLSTYLNLKRDRKVDTDYELTTDADGNLARIDMNKGTVDPITGKDGKPFKAGAPGSEKSTAYIKNVQWNMRELDMSPMQAATFEKNAKDNPRKTLMKLYADTLDEVDDIESPHYRNSESAMAAADRKVELVSRRFGLGVGGGAGAGRGRGGQPSQEDLEFTARKHGLTVQQVKQRLGIQ